MIALAISIIVLTMLLIGSVSAANEDNSNATLTVNDNSQNVNIVMGEFNQIDETSDNDDFVDEDGSKEVLKKTNDDEILKADVTGYINIRETVNETTGTFYATVGQEVGFDYAWKSLSMMQFQTLVNDNAYGNPFYPEGWGQSISDWVDTIYYTPTSAGTYKFQLICQGSSSRYVSNVLTCIVRAAAEETTTTISSDESTISPGESVKITPIVLVKGTSNPVTNGSVDIYANNNYKGTVNLATDSYYALTLNDEGTYSIYANYTGANGYQGSVSDVISVLVSADASLTPVAVNLVLNETSISPTGSISITPIVKNNTNGDVNGVVDLYDENDNIIAQNIAIGTPYIYTPGRTAGNYQIYAVYLGDYSLNYAPSNSSRVNYKVKNQISIQLSVDGQTSFNGAVATSTYDYSAGGYVYAPQYVFYADANGKNLTVEVYDNGEIVSGTFTTDSDDISLYFTSSEKGNHEIYVKFLGNDDYLPAESNIVNCNILDTKSVYNYDLTFNTSAIIEGEKVLITPSVYYYDGDYISAPGNVSLYSDSSRTDKIATIAVGEGFEYTVPSASSSSGDSSYTKYLYATYEGGVDEERSVMISPYTFYDSFSVLKQNSMSLTGNNLTDVVINFGESINLSVDIDYWTYRSAYDSNYNSVYYSDVEIYLDDELFDEFDVIRVTEGYYYNYKIEDYTITFGDDGDLGNHTIYAVYKGNIGSYSASYAPATSNTIYISVINPVKDTTLTINNITPTNIDFGQTVTIQPTLIDNDGNSVEDGEISYFVDDINVENLTVSTQFVTSPDLAVGEHNITAKYLGADGYNPSEITQKILVTVNEPIEKIVLISIDSVKYPMNITAVVNTTVTGLFTITIGDNNYPVEINEEDNGIKTVILGKVKPHNDYEARIIFDEDSTLFNSTTFNVTKATPSLIVTPSAESYKYGADAILTISLTGVDGEGLNETVVVNVDTEDHNVDVENGVGTLTISNLENGSYVVNATFNSTNEYYESVTNSDANIIINKSKVVTADVEIKDVVYGNPVILNITNLCDVDGKQLSVYGGYQLDGPVHPYGSIFVRKGEVTVPINGLPAGNYTACIVFGNNPGESYEFENYFVSFNVFKAVADMNVTVIGNNTLSGKSDKSITTYVDVFNATGKVQYFEGENQIGYDKNINETFDISDLSDGMHIITIKYVDDNNYDAEDKVVYFNVLGELATSTSVELDNDDIVKGDSILISVDVLDELNQEVNEGNVEIYDDESLIATINLAEGKSYNYTPNKSRGSYSIYAKFLKNETLKLANSTSDEVEYSISLPELTTTTNVELNVTEILSGEYILITPTVMDSNGNEVTVGTVTIANDLYGYNYLTKINAGETYKYSPSSFNPYNNPYFIYATYNGGEDEDAVYKSSYTQSGTKYYHLFKNNLVLTVDGESEITVVVGSEVYFLAKLTEGSGSIVLMNGTDEVATLTNNADYPIVFNQSGDFTFKANYTRQSGDYYSSAESENVTVHVIDLKDTELSFEGNTTVKYNEIISFAPTLKSGEELLTQGNITYSENGEDIITLNVTDVFTYTPLKTGKHNITARFNGFNEYKESCSDIIFTVEKLDMSIEAMASAVKVDQNATVEVSLSENDATGNVSVVIDGVEYVADVDTGRAVIVLPLLPAGEYSFDVAYSGDDKYEANATGVSFAVEKYDVDFTKAKGHPGRVDKNATVEVIMAQSDATGTVSINIDGVNYSEELTDGKAVIYAPLLPAGTYNTDVIYSGDDKYENNTASIIFNVNKYYPAMKATAASVRVDENATVNVALPKDATGTVTITIGGVDYTSEVIDGTSNIVLPVISEAGRFEYDVIYSGDDKYRPYQTDVTFNVLKNNVEMKATARTVRVGEDVTVNVVLSSDATGTVLINVEGVDYTADVTDGAASIVIPDLAIGQYALTVEYGGDDVYKAKNTTVTFNVNKQNSALKATARTVKVGEDVTVNVVLSSDATGTVLINVDGVDYTADVTDGAAVITIPDLAYGQYALKVQYMGDDKYKARNTTVTFNVNKQTTTMKATARTVKVGDNVTVNVVLASDVTGEVIITVDGVDYTATVENGVASILLPNLPAGQYALEVKYSGDERYKNQSTTVTFNVNKYNVKMKATAKYYEDEDYSIISVTLSDDATGTVSAEANGKIYSINVVNGIALIVISKLPAGEYSVVVVYGGDAKYKEYAVTKTFNVVK